MQRIQLQLWKQDLLPVLLPPLGVFFLPYIEKRLHPFLQKGFQLFDKSGCDALQKTAESLCNGKVYYLDAHKILARVLKTAARIGGIPITTEVVTEAFGSSASVKFQVEAVDRVVSMKL